MSAASEPAARAAAVLPIRVVGLGASAGGLDGLEQFLRHVQPRSGMAYLVVQHLNPDHKAMLAQVLQRSTRMPVQEAGQDTAVEADHVYVIPPNAVLTFGGGRLILALPSQPRGLRLPIDALFESLASELGRFAVGVVLSGMGADGTEGLRAIREAGGFTLAQEPETAQFDAMPRSAIAAQVVDVVEQPARMPRRIALSLVKAPARAGRAAARPQGEPAQQPDASTSSSGSAPAGLSSQPVEAATGSASPNHGAAEGPLPAPSAPSPSALPGADLGGVPTPPAPSTVMHRTEESADALPGILHLLRERGRHDFFAYKRSTLQRRILRRMAVHHLPSLEAYEALLRHNDQELDLLFKELLIGVTSFFRDSAVWRALKERVLPEMLRSRPDGHVFRAWLAGVSTGEEAYSLAIVFREALEAMPERSASALRIFATDLSADAIDIARRGEYHPGVAGEMSTQRLARFFTRHESFYRVSPAIREMMIFSTHDLLSDPPFTRLDLLSCRNLLIYLTAPVQRKLIPLFHYSLRREGLLLLGSSETIGRHEELFQSIDPALRLYRRRDVEVPLDHIGFPLRTVSSGPGREDFMTPSSRAVPPLSATDASPVQAVDGSPQGPKGSRDASAPRAAAPQAPVQRPQTPAAAEASVRRPAPPAATHPRPTDASAEWATGLEAPPINLQAEATRLLLEQFAPPAVVVNERGDIVYISGRTGRFLEPAAGKANWNLHVMAREGLRAPIAEALREAVATKSSITLTDLAPGGGDSAARVDITVRPLTQPTVLRGLVVVVFHEAPPLAGKASVTRRRTTGAIQRELEIQLQRAREDAQALREEMSASQEELQAANEELQSTNEELQSTNEELTSSKEEVLSMNEALQAANIEMRAKLEDLALAQSDMRNLLNSTDIATVFLDKSLNLRQFTEKARKIINLRDTDVGRPLSDLTTRLHYPELASDVQEMLRTLVACEREIDGQGGHRYLVRVLPYRTHDNVIDGAVLTFAEVKPARARKPRSRSS